MELKSTVDQAINGKHRAFDRLVDGYRDMAVGYARTLTRDIDEAEDAVQEAFLIAHRNLGLLAESEAFVAWLRGIVRHRCLRGPRRSHASLDELEEAAGNQAEPLDALYSEQLTKAVARLPLAQQTVIFLQYHEGLSQAEIAAQLGVSKATVNMRMHAARERLRRRLIMLNDIPSQTSTVGHVESVDGPLISLRFAPKQVPRIFARLTCDPYELCVVRALPDGMVQAVAKIPGGIWTPGSPVIDSGEPFLETLPSIAVEEITRLPHRPKGFLRTGVKSIDIFSPLASGGSTGIFAEWGLGTLVLVPELIRRLEGSNARQTFFVLMPPMRDSKEWQDVNAEVAVGSRSLEVFYILVEDPLSEVLRTKLSNLDTTLVLSRTLAEQGIWPCVDPLRSSSSVLTPKWAGQADDVRTVIRRYFELQYSAKETSRRLSADDWLTVRRGRIAIRLLSQPFFVAEPFTKRPGLDVDPDGAADTFANILAGRYDERNKDDFLMIGAAPD